MPDPVSAVIFALDRGVEKVSARAFDSAVAKERDETAQQEPTFQEHLLREVAAGCANASAEGIQEAIESGLVERDETGRVRLTPLGKYLAPEPVETQPDESAPAEQPIPAGAA